MELPAPLNDSLHVRRATVSDAAEISPLYVGFLGSYGHDADIKAVTPFLERVIAQPWVFFFVACDASRAIVGFAGCTLSYSAISQAVAVHINDLFVDAPARRRGVATALIGAVELHARRNAFAKIFLETAPDAAGVIDLYKKAGFEPEPFLAMTRDLSDV
jgi:ribosomal protein S18 acetylase RimI-like enzyme